MRIRWDWETFFGDTMVYGGISAADVWELLPGDLRRKFARVASGMTPIMMTRLGEGPGNFGLIRADLRGCRGPARGRWKALAAGAVPA